MDKVGKTGSEPPSPLPLNCRLWIRRRAMFCLSGVHTWGWVTSGHYFCNARLDLWRQSVIWRENTVWRNILKCPEQPKEAAPHGNILFCFVLFCLAFFFSLLTRSTLPFHAFLLHDFSLSITFAAEEFFKCLSQMYRCVPLTQYTKSIQPLQVFCIVKTVISLITGTYFKPRGSLWVTKVQTCKNTAVETFTILIRMYFIFSRPYEDPGAETCSVYVWFQASTAVLMRSALLWDFTQRKMAYF